MATPAGVQALVRAYRPQFRQPHDKVVFGVHAVLSLNGFKLVAVGPAADTAGEDVRRREDESPLDGWNDLAGSEAGGLYTLMYAMPESAPQTSPAATDPVSATPALLVRGVVMGDQVVVSFMRDPCPADKAPSTLQLDVDRYAGSDAITTSNQYAYSNVEELISEVQTAVGSQVPSTSAGSGAVGAAQSSSRTKAGHGRPTSTQQSDAEAGRHGREPEQPELDPLRDYSQPARRPVPLPTHDPLSVGAEDMMPGLLPMPGGRHQFDPFEGPGHGGFGPGGGMHMGPGHPAFTGGGGMLPGMRGGPRPGQMGGGPGPGIRWDPIRPPGLPGFNPDDYVRGGPGNRAPGQIHPDLMQPGPGRGPDWDEMFG